MTQTMENCKGVVMFCPMLSILFVGTRMRALLLTPCATGVPAQVDEDGNIKWEPEHKILFYCVVAIRVLGFFLLYGGIIAVIVGVYTMTPETANGRGAMPLVEETPFGSEPYGANDIPGTPIEGQGQPKGKETAPSGDSERDSER